MNKRFSHLEKLTSMWQHLKLSLDTCGQKSWIAHKLHYCSMKVLPHNMDWGKIVRRKWETFIFLSNFFYFLFSKHNQYLWLLKLRLEHISEYLTNILLTMSNSWINNNREMITILRCHQKNNLCPFLVKDQIQMPPWIWA